MGNIVDEGRQNDVKVKQSETETTGSAISERELTLQGLTYSEVIDIAKGLYKEGEIKGNMAKEKAIKAILEAEGV